MKKQSIQKFQVFEASHCAKSDRNVDKARKMLLNLEVNDLSLLNESISPHVTIRIDSPILRSHPLNNIVSIASNTRTLPLKFFPSNTDKNRSIFPIEEKYTCTKSLGKYKLRKISISEKKFGRDNQSLCHYRPSIDSQPSPQQRIFTRLSPKPRKKDIVRMAITKLHECANTARINLEECLKMNLKIKGDNKVNIGLNSINEKQFKKHNTKSNSPEIGNKKKGNYIGNPLVPPKKPSGKTQILDKRQRRHTTLCHTSNIEAKNITNAFAAIEKLALEPVIK